MSSVKIEKKYKIIRFICGPLIKILWLGRVVGLENIPKSGACIIVANHESYLDFILLFALSPRKLTFLAAEKFFRSRVWAPIMYATGQIKVERSSNNKGDVYEAVDQVLKGGHILALFPEGTRSRTGEMQKAFNGSVMFAKKYGCPLIPVGIEGAYAAWPPGNKLPKLKKINIAIGKKIDIESDNYETETRNVMITIARLANKNYKY